MEGISVIICCYNSAWVISRTLKCLIKQENIANINYQIIVVDNNSTDDTTRIVLDYIKTYVDVDIKLFYEKRQGLIYARECGMSQSKYSYLLFCDDDNLLCEYYVSTVYEEMEENPSLGACGGYGIAEFYNCVEPEWFKLVASGYAIGKQNAANNYLYGASCCYRKSALEKLYAIGFKPILTGRKGNVLLAGDDGELAMGILLMSYTLKAIDRVNFVHVLPASRLNLNYLSKNIIL